MLSRNDIEHALANGNLKIFPFEKKNLTGIGYNLSTTDFAFSIKRGILLTVHQRTTESGVMRYVIIPGNDTVLFFSKEYIEVDNTLAGTFHSKVSCVSQGLGHISTTLDPTWKGQLLISVNNPTASDIIFNLEKSGGNIVTLLLHQLDSPVTGDNIHDNNKGRCELLIAHFTTSPSASKYKSKHLEVKEFVQKELADSLNGYDHFLAPDQPQDRYSKKIRELMELRNRLELDRSIINEGRYKLGENGKYFCFRSDTELALIRSCVLYELKPTLREALSKSDEVLSKSDETLSKSDETLSKSNKAMAGFEAAQLSDACPIINECIEVIKYELDMIDHIRRIYWQNSQVHLFAGEDSELVRIRRSADRARRIKRCCFSLLAILLFTGLFFWVLIGPLNAFSGEGSTGVIFSTVYASILAFALQKWWKFWHN